MADGFEFCLGIGARLPLARLSQRAPHPLTDRNPFASRQSLDFEHFRIGQNDLKPLTHTLSITYSMMSIDETA